MKKLLISLLIAAAPLPALAEECRTYRSPQAWGPKYQYTFTIDGIDDHVTFERGFDREDLEEWDCDNGPDTRCYGPKNPDAEIYFVVKGANNANALVAFVWYDNLFYQWEAACDRR